MPIPILILGLAALAVLHANGGSLVIFGVATVNVNPPGTPA